DPGVAVVRTGLGAAATPRSSGGRTAPLELVVPGQLLPAEAAEGGVVAVRRGGLRGGLEPDDGEGGAVVPGVDRLRVEGAEAGHRGQQLDGAEPAGAAVRLRVLAGGGKEVDRHGGEGVLGGPQEPFDLHLVEGLARI